MGNADLAVVKVAACSNIRFFAMENADVAGVKVASDPFFLDENC
jgi:hypothetical protein